MKRVLGMEPAAIVLAVETTLTVLVAFNLFDLSRDDQGVIMTVVVGLGAVITAWATVNTRLSAVLGFTKTVLVALVYFGSLAWTETQISLVVAAIAASVGIFIRQSNSSTDTSISLSSPGAPELRRSLGKPDAVPRAA